MIQCAPVNAMAHTLLRSAADAEAAAGYLLFGRQKATGHPLGRTTRQFVAGMALAVLVGPYDIFGWLSLSLLILFLGDIILCKPSRYG